VPVLEHRQRHFGDSVAARADEEPAIINLMDALKQSLQEARHTGNGKPASRGKSAARGGKSRGHRTAGRRKTG
jgi:non-homologous end joining protein Ku